MNRLIQGDVGSGKTIVAILAMFMCVMNHHQAAFMAPTEVLAKQHYESITKLTETYGLPFKPVLLTGSLTAKEKRRAKEGIVLGTCNVIVGTQALLQDDVDFYDLRLVITDEQHRFGVKQRETFAQKGIQPHILVMSATPIPRTLALILYGDLDISVMDELPANRLPIKNCVVNTDFRKKAYEFIAKEVAIGRQAYVICPMVEANEEIMGDQPVLENVVEYTEKLKKALPDTVRVEYLHGQMNPKAKNYVMEEYGQPMHAYDLDTIAGNQILVRRAEKNEKFVTLDGQERTMDDSVLMICDGEKAIGIAGIMGGENSMITDSVKTMLFEAACFDGVNIRLSAKKVGLRTEASGKFEKGLDPNNAQAAIDRACQLIEELGAGEVVDGMVDVYTGIKEPIRVPFDAEKINALLGTDITKEQMLSYLHMAELEYDDQTGEVLVPTFRQDVLRLADLAEEVARFYGYDNIPTTLPTGEATTGKLPFKLRLEAVARDIAEFCGFSQGMTYSFESPKVFDKLLLDGEDPLRRAVTISNPLGEDFSIMRTTSLNGMLTSLATNYNRRNKNVRLYELGNIYMAKELPLTELPDERMQFTLGMYGEGDFYTMKGVVEEFFDKIGLHEKEVYDPKAGKPFLHPGRQANIIYCGKVVGYLGEVHPTVADTYGIGERAYVAVLDMPAIEPFATFDRKYEGIAKYPAVNRDISMVIPKSVLAGQIEEVIENKGGSYLESYQLFDVYEGAQIKQGYKSMAYSIVFRAKDKTLEEADVASAMKRILKGLEALDAELRQ